MNRNSLIIDRLDLEAGGTLEPLEIVYHTSGTRGGKVVWICHALTANSDPEDWWPGMVGPGKAIDTDKHFVICANIPGSPYGSTGPASINPKTGKPYMLDFPALTLRDMTATSQIVRKHLGIEKIDLLIGSSIGGFQAIEWAVSEPELFKNALFIATAPRISPWMTAWMEAQRMALEADQTFRQAKDLSGGANGLRCARAQALISYRCFEGFEIRQSEPDPDCLFAGRAASYERHQGDQLVNRNFDAYSYWTIANAMDSHNVGRGRGGVKAALGRITANTTVISIDTDGIFPPMEIERWAPMIPGSRHIGITSKFGHDGFLLENDLLTEIISPILG